MLSNRSGLDRNCVHSKGGMMTTEGGADDSKPAESAPINKLPVGYAPTNTEMVIRGAGMQSEAKDKRLET